jgi:hypothetical protein
MANHFRENKCKQTVTPFKLSTHVLKLPEYALQSWHLYFIAKLIAGNYN